MICTQRGLASLTYVLSTDFGEGFGDFSVSANADLFLWVPINATISSFKKVQNLKAFNLVISEESVITD